MSVKNPTQALVKRRWSYADEMGALEVLFGILFCVEELEQE